MLCNDWLQGSTADESGTSKGGWGDRNRCLGKGGPEEDRGAAGHHHEPAGSCGQEARRLRSEDKEVKLVADNGEEVEACMTKP